MNRTTLLGLAVILTLAGCARIADSRLNPFNWFGGSENEANTAAAAPAEIRPLVPEGREVVVIESRPLVQSVQSLTVDRTPSGAIVRATGLAPTQGFFNAELVSRGIDGGVLTLDFRAQAPAGFQPEGSARSRQITAAYLIDASLLAGIRTIRVQAQSNARTSSR